MDYYNNINESHQKNIMKFNSLYKENLINKSNEKNEGFIKTKQSSDNLYNINNIINNNSNNLNYKNIYLNKHRKNYLSCAGNNNINQIIKSHFKNITKDGLYEDKKPNQNFNEIGMNNYNFTMSKNIEENTNVYDGNNDNILNKKNQNKINDFIYNHKLNNKKNINNNSLNESKDKLYNLSSNHNNKEKYNTPDYNLPRQITTNKSSTKILNNKSSFVGLHKNNHNNKNMNNYMIRNYNSNKDSEYKSDSKSTKFAIKFDMHNNSFSENNNLECKSYSDLNDAAKTENEQNISNYEKCKFINISVLISLIQ